MGNGRRGQGVADVVNGLMVAVRPGSLVAAPGTRISSSTGLDLITRSNSKSGIQRAYARSGRAM